MKNAKKYILFLLRISLGWLLLYSGITKILDSSWSAAGYLNSATTFPQFYTTLATPEYLNTVNLINEWGLVLLGATIILGLFTKFIAPIAALLMMLYYFPVLDFPYVGEHNYIISEHIIYALGFLTLMVTNAGKYWGLDKRLRE